MHMFTWQARVNKLILCLLEMYQVSYLAKKITPRLRVCGQCLCICLAWLTVCTCRRCDHDRLVQLLQDSGYSPTLQVLRCRDDQQAVLCKSCVIWISPERKRVCDRLDVFVWRRLYSYTIHTHSQSKTFLVDTCPNMYCTTHSHVWETRRHTDGQLDR